MTATHLHVHTSSPSLSLLSLSVQQFEKILKQRHLEVQLSEAKLAQHTVVAAEEKEIGLQERQQVVIGRAVLAQL